ncbi:MAG: heptosyltransferase [Campylobacterota bacterium]|nr:heptosyltransferase [Campylobacterota bacterium]
MRVAIVKLSAMGDIIHACLVLQFIKREFPKAKIDWIVEDVFAPLLKNNPDIDSVYSVSLKKIKKNKNFSLLMKNIKTLKSLGTYDYIIDMQGLFKSALVAKMIGKNIYGFDKNSTREKIATLFYKKSFSIPYDLNVILRGVKLVENSLNTTITNDDILNKKPFLFSDKKAKESIKEYLKGKEKPITVVVGASWKSKIYPPELMAQMLEKLQKNAYLVWGNEEEERMANEIAKLTKYAVKAKKFTIEELIEFIASSRLVIGADTGPVHMAWALNVPSVTIFGPTPYFRNTMTTNINKTIDSGKKIDPSNLDKNDFCIKNILPQEIAKLASELIGE